MGRWPASVGALLFALCGAACAQEPVVGSTTLLSLDGPSSAYPNGTFAEQLTAASQGGGGPVGGPRNRPGPGRRDDWKVGPHWRVTVDGLVLFRDDADLDAILAGVAPLNGDPLNLAFRENFDHAAGVRVLMTSEFPQCAGYELQVGYLGAEEWAANAYYDRFALGVTNGQSLFQQRQLVYDASLHSAEVNLQQDTAGYLKPYAGFRYIGFDERISDENRQFTTGVLDDPVNVGDSVVGPTITQTRNAVEAENNLIGFHGGLRLDMWRPTRRLHLNGFLSAGVYCNVIDRERIFQETTSVTTATRVQDATTMIESINSTTATGGASSIVSADGTRIAFATEAALAATWRINNALAVRGGYQILFVQEVQLAEDLWTAPPPITPVEDDLFLHGWFAGIEYRR